VRALANFAYLACVGVTVFLQPFGCDAEGDGEGSTADEQDGSSNQCNSVKLHDDLPTRRFCAEGDVPLRVESPEAGGTKGGKR